MSPKSTAADIQSGKMSTSTSKAVTGCRSAVMEFCDMMPRKRQKGNDGMAVEDRISNLPDVLLDKILSSLPTKDAVATSVLSRRWRRAFTWLTRLDFDDSPISHCVNGPHLIDSFPVFKMFVDNVLQACQSECLTTFRLHFGTVKRKSGWRTHYCVKDCFPQLETCRVYAWMCFPLTRGVRELDLCVRTKEYCWLPSALFSFSTLEVLKLDVRFDFVVPLSSCLPNLKELHLTLSFFPDGASMTRLLSSCPSLEHLVLEGRLEPSSPVFISSSSLRRLAILIPDFYGYSRSKVVLDVPNLEYLVYKDIFACQYSIGDLNSLVEAQVDTFFVIPTLRDTENIFSLVSSLSNARRLFLMQGCIEALDTYESEYKDFYTYESEYKLPIFRNLNLLQLGCAGYYEWNKVLLELLSCAPFLETLDFPEGIVCDAEEEYDVYMRVSEQECGSWSKTRVIPSCVGLRLKRISIKSYELTEWELAMVKYFLINALVLEELTVVCKASVLLADRILLDCTLQKLPRGSMTCSVKVE